MDKFEDKWKTYSIEEILEGFYFFARDNSTWISEIADESTISSEALTCLSEISGAARFIEKLTEVPELCVTEEKGD